MTQGLTLLAEHQEGVVPKIVATLKTQAKTQVIQRNIPRPTAAQFAQMQACFAKQAAKSGTSTTPSQSGGGGGGFGGGGGGGSGFGGVDRGAFSKCLPASMRRLRTRFTTPSQTLRQVLNPPQTNITTTAYTIGGVDQTHPTMGVVTTSQVTKGRYLSPAGGHEALISQTYAAKHSLKVGSVLNLNGTKFTVVGLVSPPLGGQSADVYLPLKQLQTLAHEAGLANVVLVRATSGKNVSQVQAGDPGRAAAGAGRELEGRRRQDQRLARRRVEPFARSRLRALCDRGRCCLHARRAADALVGRQARPRARNAEGARLDAAHGRPPDRR